ncbi:hypothetical protein [Hymenobacter metallicola]|uniref:Outer membrane protein beta-barrel domain-containing protein n=1 Tax=Hymenobacter metallicola TaxID=2563114 RepID=A0A4Z0QB09_9BACT|nr:hypothetical protein [Hymenobacter metallicola]TGE27267.1 hypothetical protein E5K02_12810 [Hymenobacter metallicola]
MKALVTTILLAAAATCGSAVAQTKTPAKAASTSSAPATKTTVTKTSTTTKATTKPAVKPATTAKPVTKPTPAPAPAATPAPAETTTPASTTTSTTEASGELFRKGTNMVNLGVGLLGVGYGYSIVGSNYSSTPVMSVSFEHGIKEGLGPGTIGVGGLVGYRADTWKYAGYRGTWSNTYVALRGTYHYNIFQTPKLDTYAGLTLGVRVFSYSDNDDSSADYYSSSTYAHSGIFAGARYFFTNNIGAFAELGYDMSYLKVGLAAKF